MNQIYEDQNGNVTIVKDPPIRKKAQPPMKIRVVFYNDDYTPMEFVVWALMTIYHHNEIDANSIMSEVHTKGRGTAGIYDYQIAEQKIWEVLSSARENEFPLQVTGERE